MMKYITKILMILVAGLMISSCDLQEEPTFLSEESAYKNLTNATATLNGVYNSFAGHNYYGYDLIYSSYGGSGFYVSGIQGSNQATDNVYLCSLKPQPSATYNENTWERMYNAINRANNFIYNVKEIESPETPQDWAWNNLIGEAHFLRAFTYFHIVRLWGEAPLRLEPSTLDNLNKPKSSTKEIYTQIIEDAEMAKRLMRPKGLEREGFPAREAANMLLAKVYMTMATVEDEVPIEDSHECWQKAYDEAKQVYGKYSLLENYHDLWDQDIGDNSRESIFEIQYNKMAKSSLGQLFTASHAILGNTWGRLKINAERVDAHLLAYPNDTIRYKATFKTGYVKMNNMKYTKVYPENTKRSSFGNAFPYCYKYWIRDKTNVTGYTNKNYFIYRYADLLLMLAEISNELQNGEEMTYLTEVLDRVGLTPRDKYSQGQDAFREAIMEEYNFEELGEGHEWFNNRRRGYEWFKSHVIDVHNNWEKFNPKVDVTLEDDKETVMHNPIPTSEINTNDDINN